MKYLPYLPYLPTQNGGVFKFFELNDRETRYFLIFQKSGRPMLCSCLIFLSYNISSSDLEERDENQEIEKAKVSGGRSVGRSFI